MIIGLTGTIAAGKTTVAEILKKRGFEHYTYSDILRIEAKKRDINPTRENLQALGNKFKEESRNNGILSKLIIENAKSKDIVADGIRTVEEIHELKKHGAWVIAVDAEQRTRFERLHARQRAGDPLTFEKFKEIDENENTGKTPGQFINACMKEADCRIENNGSMKELEEKTLKILNAL